MIANGTREFVTVQFRRGVSAIAFGCLTTKALNLAPAETSADLAWGRYAHGANCPVARLTYGPLDAAQSRALDDLLRAYAAHPGHRGALHGWVRTEAPA